MSGYVLGAQLLLGALLASAGLLKLLQPGPFTHALHRLLPARLESGATLARAAAPTVGTTEVVVGAGLLGAAWWPEPVSVVAGVASAVLFLAFVPVVVVAIRKGTACGCWSSFSDGVAGGTEMGRAVSLAAIATVLSVTDVAALPPRGWHWVGLVWLAGLGAAVAAAALIGATIDRRGVASQPLSGGATPGEGGGNGRGRAAQLLVGRVTSAKSRFTLPTVYRLTPEERDRLAESALASPTGRAFMEWLGERAAGIDWSGGSAHSTTIQVGEARSRHVMLKLPPAEGVELNVSVKNVGSKNGSLIPTGDATFLGTVDGLPVVATAGKVVSQAHPSKAGRSGEAAGSAGGEAARGDPGGDAGRAPGAQAVSEASGT